MTLKKHLDLDHGIVQIKIEQVIGLPFARLPGRRFIFIHDPADRRPERIELVDAPFDVFLHHRTPL